MAEHCYKFRIYPTKIQQDQIQQTFGCARYVYNHFLDRRITQYKETGETLGYVANSRDLTQMKNELDWLCVPDSTALQSSLKALDLAYQNFFRRVKQGGQAPGFPKFKSKKSSRKSYCTKSRSIHVLERAVQLPKLGQVKCRVSKEVEGRILSATISQNPSGKYFVSLCCTKVEVEQSPSTGAVVGIDLGLRYFAYTSDGQRIESPQCLEKSKKVLARIQRQLSRKTIGSANREKARLRVARLQEHIANQRQDFLQKLSTNFVRQYDVVCMETLEVRRMQQSNPYLARQISDAGWAEFLRQVQYKCVWQHKGFVKVDRLYPSTQLCSECGYQNYSLKKRYQKEWECPQCKAIHDIDYNAAQNILQEGLRLLKVN